MNTTKYYSSSLENKLTYDDMKKDYALVAVGNGATSSVRKAFENECLRKRIHFFRCGSKHPGSCITMPIDAVSAEQGTAIADMQKTHPFKKAIVVSTLGGRTGTKYAPIILKLLADAEIESASIVTLPFSFEGQTRLEKAQKALLEISRYSKCTTVFNMDNLKNPLGEMKIGDFFSILDSCIENAVISYLPGQ